MSAAPTLAPVMPAGQSAEHLKVKLRPDLVVQPQFYEGMTHYVIKDPLALKYFRFKIEEYFLLQQFDGKQNLQDVKKAFERKYRPQTISIEDLTRFVAQLHEAGIVQIDSPEQAKVLIRRRRKNRWRKVWQFIANILYIKIPIIDPERLLTGMYPYFRWIFTTYFITASVGTRCSRRSPWSSASGTSSTPKLPEFQSFFNWCTILSFWISLAIVKVIHEFGHGLTAKHFGGEVHEMGMLFLVLTPALYCDVTDSWLLPNKWKRIWISAAGIYVECFLASIATFVWWNTEPGLLNSLAMATMFICSVNTILFNANPLLRYDGYYVMADWLEIPNLRIKSTQFFAYLFQEKVLGLEIPVQNYMPRSRRYLFVIYAIASYLYRWVVTFSIMYFLSQVLKPYKLQLDQLHAGDRVAGSAVGDAGLPDGQVRSHAREDAQSEKGTSGRLRGGGRRHRRRDPPDPDSAASPGDAGPDGGETRGDLCRGRRAARRAQGPRRRVGQERHRPGHALQPREARERAACRRQQIRRQLRQGPVVRASRRQREHRAMARQHVQMAEDLEPTIDEGQRADRQADPGRRAATARSMGVPHPETVGQWLKPGKPFCEVGDPHKLEAHLILDQSDIDLIRLGRTRLGQDLRRLRDDLQERGRARSPSGTARRFRPSSRTWPAARSRPSRTRRPAQIKPHDRRLRGDHPDRQPRSVPPARPARVRQDRRRHPHPRLVALAADHQDVPLHDLTQRRSSCVIVALRTLLSLKARSKVAMTVARAGPHR